MPGLSPGVLAQTVAMVALHVLFGLLGIGSGAIALGVAKGSRTHIRSGQVFVGAMLLMCSTGFTLAVTHANPFSRLNAIAATLTAYLVLSGFLTVRRGQQADRWPECLLAAAALCIASASIFFGFGASAIATGPPATAFFIFGAFALVAVAGDVRTIVRGVVGARRLARHLWRMGVALWIATASFFLGQARVFPEALRKPALLALPVLVVLGAVLYWLVRIRRPMTPSGARKPA